MEYESLFSTSVKQKIRLIVEQSDDSIAMSARVKSEFGEAALSIARQMAEETRGVAWLRREQSLREEAVETMPEVLDGGDSARWKKPKSPELARALARGRAAMAAESLAIKEKMSETPVVAKAHEPFPSTPLADRIGLQARVITRQLWSKYSSVVWIALAVVVLAKCSDDYEKQKIIDEKASVGTLATVTGSMFAAALQSCKLIGFSDFDMCASNNGILVQDITAKQLASAAISQRKNYIATCGKYYSQDYCWDQLNRAYRISQYSNR